MTASTIGGSPAPAPARGSSRSRLRRRSGPGPPSTTPSPSTCSTWASSGASQLNTLAAYRRDLTRYAGYLAARGLPSSPARSPGTT